MTNTKSLPFYFEIFSSIYQLTSLLDEPFSAYNVKKAVVKDYPELKITLKDVKKVVKALYKERDPVFEGFVAQPSWIKKGDEDVKVLFYCPVVENGNKECCSDDSEVESTVNNYNDDPQEYYDSDETKYPECIGCCCYVDKKCNSKIGCWLHPTKKEENLKSLNNDPFTLNCDGCYYYDSNKCKSDKCHQTEYYSLRKELDDFERDYLCTDKNGKKFYSKPKIEWVDGPEPDVDEEHIGSCICNCFSCKEDNVMKVKFNVEDPDVLVDEFKKVSVKMKPVLLLHDQVKQVREVLKKFVEEKKNFSAYELKKEVLKAYPELKATTKAVRKVLDQIFCTNGDILSDYNRSPHYITKGDKRVKVLFYYPGVRGKKLGMNYVVPTLESTVSAGKLKPSLIGGEEEVLYSNEESKYSKELYERLESIETSNEKLNDLDEVLQKVLSSTKVVWVLNAILKAFETKDFIKSKLIEVYSDVKGFYS